MSMASSLWIGTSTSLRSTLRKKNSETLAWQQDLALTRPHTCAWTTWPFRETRKFHLRNTDTPSDSSETYAAEELQQHVATATGHLVPSSNWAALRTTSCQWSRPSSSSKHISTPRSPSWDVRTPIENQRVPVAILDNKGLFCEFLCSKQGVVGAYCGKPVSC